MSSPQLDFTRKMTTLLDSDIICEGEFVNEFLTLVFETPIETVPECASLVPVTSRVAICKYCHEFAELDYFDIRHMFDKRSYEHKRVMHDHYEQVTQMLLALLGCGNNPEK